MSIVDIEKSIAETSGFVILMVSSERCLPCKDMFPIFEGMASDYEDTDFLHVKKEDALEFCQSLGICFFPTLLVYNDGELLKEHVVCSTNYEQEVRQALDPLIEYVAENSQNPEFQTNRPPIPVRAKGHTPKP